MQSTGALTGARHQPLTAARRGRTRPANDRWLLVRLCAELVADALLAWLAFWLAYALRYRLHLGGPILPADEEPFATFYGKAALFVGLTLIVLVIRRAYRLPRWTGLLDETILVTGGITTAMAGVILWAFFLRFAPSRLVFIYAWLCAVALLLARRVLGRWIKRRLWASGRWVDRVLIVGATHTGHRVMQAMMANPALGYRVVGMVDDEPHRESGGVTVATERRVLESHWLGRFDQVGDIVAEHEIDEVIIALRAHEQERVIAIVDQCRVRDVSFKVVPDLFQQALDRVDLGEVAGIPLIGIKRASITGGSYRAKRATDAVIAAGVLTVMALPMLIIALLIRRDSPGPVFVRQWRVGVNGRLFRLMKFRTMVDNAHGQRAELLATGVSEGDADPRLFKLRDDPRLTSVGRWLRRFSLDELPQFMHVLRGEMSVVGPRPPLPEEVAGYDDWHRQRLLVTPGLTGLWQVNGRSHLTFDEMVRLDLYYAEHWSMWLDVKIVLRTIPAVVTGRGAY